MRHVFTALTCIAFAAAGTSVAVAGTVQIKSCSDAPLGGTDSAWVVVNDNGNGYQEPSRVCPPTGSVVGTDLDHAQILGLSVWTKLSSGVAPASGQRAEIRFSAPAGTVVSAASVRRDIGMRSDGYYVYGRSDTGQLTGETCTRPGGEYGCSIGGYGAGYASFTGLNAGWIAWGFQCGANAFPTCGTGSSLHSAWAHLYGAVVTLTDNQLPTGVVAGGNITTAGWKGGTAAGTISGSDNLGVQKLRWYADGVVVSTSADRSCDFSVTVPCSNASGVSYGLNTTGLGDGSHSVEAAVVDPAGNEAKGTPFTVKLDNTAPPPPIGLHVGGGGGSTAIAMSWSLPAADGASAYVSSAWQACSGGTCSSGTGGLTSASGNLPNATGVYAVKVWLVDAAGNGGPATAATSSVSYTAPAGSGGGGGGGGGGGAAGGGAGGTTTGEPSVPIGPTPTSPGPGLTPTPTPTPVPAPRAGADLRLTTSRLDRRTGRLVLRGSIDDEASGTVTITVTAKGERRRLQARIRAGHYTAVTRLRKGTRGVRVTVRYGGSSSTMPGRATRTVTSR